MLSNHRFNTFVRNPDGAGKLLVTLLPRVGAHGVLVSGVRELSFQLLDVAVGAGEQGKVGLEVRERYSDGLVGGERFEACVNVELEISV